MNKKTEMITESVLFHGHPQIVASHKTTFEITKENHLTERGNCIIGIGANKGCADLSVELKNRITDNRSIIRINVVVEENNFVAYAKGSSNLILNHPSDIVIMKSDYSSERTLAIKCDKSASDIPSKMKDSLRDPLIRGVMTISVWSGD